MNKKMLFLTTVATVYGANISNAAVFSDNIYSKHKLSVGYEFQDNANIKNQLDNVKKEFATYNPHRYVVYLDGPVAKNKKHALTVNFGENFYYKMTELLHPFIGIDAQARIPLNGRANVKFSEGCQAKDPENLEQDDRTVGLDFMEHARLGARMGVKINVVKNFAIEAYGLTGINFATAKMNDAAVYRSLDFDPEEPEASGVSTEASDLSNTRSSIGYNVGVGTEAIVWDKFTVGLEYRYSANNFSSLKGVGKNSIKNHSVGIKLGIQF